MLWESKTSLLFLLLLLLVSLVSLTQNSEGLRPEDRLALVSLRNSSMETNRDGGLSPGWTFDPLQEEEQNGTEVCGNSNGHRFIQCDSKGFITRL